MIVTITLYIIISLVGIGSIIFYGHRPSRSIGWILTILLLPFVGVVLYLMFGVNRREFKIFALKESQKRRLYDQSRQKKIKTEDLNSIPLKQKKIALLLANSSGYQLYNGNSVKILKDGKKTFDSLFEKLRQATEYIHMQYFIIEEGELLNEIYQIFKDKIIENVKIRVIYDAIGSSGLSKKTIKKFSDLGVEMYPISPLKFGTFLFTLNYRNHRKIVVIDGTVGFIGGVNISDKYVKKSSHLGIWDDEHLQIQGPAVRSLQQIFLKDYYFASDNDLNKDTYLSKIEDVGNAMVQIVASGPDSNYSSVMQQYIALIHVAEKQILIANPYFMPSRSVMQAIKIAALSGTKIKLLVPKKSDSWLAKNSMFSYFTELLTVGIEIYLSDSFLHSKIVIVDNLFVSVGSGNFDYRSFEQNFEANALIYNQEIAHKMTENFLKDCEQCTMLNLETHRNRNFRDKFKEGFARLFSPLL